MLLFAVCFRTAVADSTDQTVNQFLDQAEYDAAVSAASADSRHYLYELIVQARDKKLYEAPTWLALIHYKSSLFLGTGSQVDDPEFFFSKRGKRSPQAELEATLASFFTQNKVLPTRLSPQCRFVARFNWLKRKLNFNPDRLAAEQCPLFDKFKQGIDADSFTLIFASTHPNSPSSMFGHTLLRIDKKDQTAKTRMLSYTINYAAQVDISSEVMYALWGLTGGFKGRFRMLPYYMKLREYAQMESRGLWEYKLGLTPEQMDFVLMHTYELAPSYFDYYFFSENCSYHMLSLLEAAMPEANLTESFDGKWAIPVDTVRLLDKKGLIESVYYQPPKNTNIEQHRKSLTVKENSIALRLLDEGFSNNDPELKSLTEERQAQVLDLYYAYLRFDRVRETGELDTKLSKKEHQALRSRSKLPVKSKDIVIPTPKIRPDLGHKTARLGLGVGYQDQRFMRFSWRPAYHDLLDSPAGYRGYSQLEFLNLELRYFDDDDKLELERLTIVDILSLEARDNFFRNISWQVNTSVDNFINDEQDLSHYFSASGGAGLAYALSEDKRTMIYGFINAGIDIGGGFDSDYRLLAGPSLGVVGQLTDRWGVQLESDYLASITGDKGRSTLLSFGQNVALTPNLSLRLNLQRTRERDAYANEVLGQILVYH